MSESLENDGVNDTEYRAGIPFVAFTTMANFFLERIVQPNYLSDLETKLGRNFTNITDLEKSWEVEKNHWGVYLLGFFILIIVGCLATATLLILGPVTVVCLLTGTYPCERTLNQRRINLPLTSWRVLGLIVVVLTALMLTVVIHLHLMSVSIKSHGTTTVFIKINESLNGLDLFFKQLEDDLQNRAVDTIQQAKRFSFRTLSNIPNTAALALNSETGRQTINSVKRLHILGAQKLPKLRNDLEEVLSMVETSKIDEQGGQFSPEEQTADDSVLQSFEIAEKVQSLLNVVNIATENITRRVEANESITHQLSASHEQLIAAIEVSTLEPVEAIKEQIKYVEGKIISFASTMSGFSISKHSKHLEDIQNKLVPVINAAYALPFLIFLILLLITLLPFVAFILHFPYWIPSQNRIITLYASRILFRSAHFLILLTVWMYWGAATLMFLAGPAHTEICRHIIDYHNPNSKLVIPIFDAYIADKIFGNKLPIKILETYTNCEKDQSIYRAGNLEKTWRPNGLFGLHGLQTATDQMLYLTLGDHRVSFLSSEAKALVNRLDVLHTKIDFTNMTTKLHALINNTTTYSSSRKHIEKLLRKLEEIANDTDLYDLHDLTRDLMVHQDDINKIGEIAAQRTAEISSKQAYNTIAFAVRQIESDVINKIGKCRELYLTLRPGFEELCIQTLYPINGYWFGLGLAILLLMPISAISFMLSEYLGDHPPSVISRALIGRADDPARLLQNQR